MCKLCNNLDPRSHPATFHDQESTSRSVARLSLRVDPVRLKRSEENCPRCRLVAHALDAHVEGWRKTKPRLLLDLVECAPLRLEVRPDVGGCENIEIYAPFGKLVSFFRWFVISSIWAWNGPCLRTLSCFCSIKV